MAFVYLVSAYVINASSIVRSVINVNCYGRVLPVRSYVTPTIVYWCIQIVNYELKERFCILKLPWNETKKKKNRKEFWFHCVMHHIISLSVLLINYQESFSYIRRQNKRSGGKTVFWSYTDTYIYSGWFPYSAVKSLINDLHFTGLFLKFTQ